MKIKFLLVAVALLAASCAKEKSGSPTTKTQVHPLTFAVSGFDVKAQPIGKSKVEKLAGIPLTGPEQDTLRSKIGFLYFRIYTKDFRTIVKSKDQASTDANFGTYQDSIADGTYNVLILGSKDAIRIAPTSTSDTQDSFFSTFPGTDVFFVKLEVTVNGGALSQAFVLERLMSRIDLELKNPVPSNAAKLVVSGGHWKSNMQVSTLPELVYQGYRDYTYEYSHAFVDAEKGKPYKISLYCLPKSLYSTINNSLSNQITITAYDSANQVITSQTVSNVLLLRNTKYVVSGNFFSAGASPGGAGLSVSVNDQAWTDQQIPF